MDLFARSLLPETRVINFLFNRLSEEDTEPLKAVRALLLVLRKETVLKREYWSTIVRKYLQPPADSTETGPTRSI